MRKRISTIKEHTSQASIYSITDEEIESLAENIDRVGQLEPCIITPNNVLISGYTRVAALKYLGKKTCDCRVLDIPEKGHCSFVITNKSDKVHINRLFTYN